MIQRKRIAGTIRDFQTFNFAQKDGLLAAFFELFFASNRKSTVFETHNAFFSVHPDEVFSSS